MPRTFRTSPPEPHRQRRLRRAQFVRHGGANPQNCHQRGGQGSRRRQQFRRPTGTGAIKRNETVTLRLAGVVTQVLPNGNLVVAARQEVRVNSELRDLQVSGIIRPQDIASDNTVHHDRMAEARIAYGGRGQLSDMQTPRYGQQALESCCRSDAPAEPPSLRRPPRQPCRQAQSPRWTRSMRSWRSCASIDRVAIGRACKPLEADRLSGFLAEAVGAVLDALQSLSILEISLRARSRVRSSSARSVSTLARSVMSDSWMPPSDRLASVPSASLEQIRPPAQELLAEEFDLHGRHELFRIGRPVVRRQCNHHSAEIPA